MVSVAKVRIFHHRTCRSAWSFFDIIFRQKEHKDANDAGDTDGAMAYALLFFCPSV